jgi:hypothetical protein
LELVLAGGFPKDGVVSLDQTAPEDFASAALGQTDQHLLAGVSRRLDNAEHAKIAIANKQALPQATQHHLAGQGLLAQMDGAQGTVQGGSAQGAQANDHAHEAPVGPARILVGIGR